MSGTSRTRQTDWDTSPQIDLHLSISVTLSFWPLSVLVLSLSISHCQTLSLSLPLVSASSFCSSHFMPYSVCLSSLEFWSDVISMCFERLLFCCCCFEGFQMYLLFVIDPYLFHSMKSGFCKE